MDVYGTYPLVIKCCGFENPRTKCRLQKAGKIINGGLSTAMFDYRRVCIYLYITYIYIYFNMYIYIYIYIYI